MKPNRKINLIHLFCLCGMYSMLSAQQNDTEKTIHSAKQGAIVSLPGVLENDMQNLNYSKKSTGAVQLLMSDDPEYVEDTAAIVLKESVKPGEVRLYVYNVNGVVSPDKMKRKIIAVIKNTSGKIMHFQMLRSASMKPSSNYYEMGKMGLAKFFASRHEKRRVIKPGEIALIDPSMDNQVASYNELVHGLYEFQIDQPAEVTVLQTSPYSNFKEAFSRIKDIVPRAHINAGRGLFTPADYIVKIADTIDTRNKPYVLKVADGKTDKWIVGKEGDSGNRVELAGNYGVMYDITIPWISTDGKSLALLTWNPMSGLNRWCEGMANSMVVSKGKFKAGVAVLPSDSLAVKKSPDAILIQVFPAGKGVQYIHLKYSPPGASCLPTPLVFLPIK